jgi:O-antigen/teichoic acid export membrane protein
LSTPEPTYRKVGQDIGIVGIASLLQSLSAILLLPVITKILGAHDYGLYVQFAVTISLIMAFAMLGLPYGTVRFLAGVTDRKQIQDDIYSTIVLILLTSLIVASIVFAFSESLAAHLFGGLTILVRILAVVMLIECISGTLLNIFRVFQQVKKYAILSIIKTYSELALVVAVILMGYGIVEVAFSVLLIRFLFLIVLAVMIIPKIGIKSPRFSRMKDYLRFSLPTVGSNIAGWIINSSDRYIIGILIGVTFVGYYNLGYSLGGIILMFMVPVDFVLVAVVSKYYDEGKIDVVRNLFKHAIKYFLLLAIPAFLGLSILSKPILTILSTPEMANQGYLITPFIAFSMVLSGIGGVAIGKSLYLAKKTHISMINTIMMVGINFGLNMLLIPRMGIIGAAIAALVAFSAGFTFETYFAFKYFDFDIDWRSIIKTVVASAIMSGLIINLHPNGVWELILTILAGFVLYSAAILLLRTITKGELAYFKSLINMKQA